MQGYRLSRRVTAVSAPPIPLARAWADAYTGAQRLLDVSQGIPGSGPHETLKDALSKSSHSDAGAQYAPILGETALRRLLAAEMKTVYGNSTDISEQDIGLTAGCNLGFFASVMTLAEPGDEIILPVPWYFNHQMTLEMLGITIVSLPLHPSSGFMPSLSECASLINSKTRAIVLVTPNNPTGTVYPPDIISSFLDLARANNIALILDETYRDFVIPSKQYPHPHDLFLSSDWRSNLVHLFSFSKSYAIPGHRLGAIVASPGFLSEVATVLDSIQICPPRAPQLALSSTPTFLSSLRPHLESTSRSLEHRHMLFRNTLVSPSSTETPNDRQWVVGSSGGYFAFVRHPFSVSAEEVCKAAASQTGVVMLPATFFAPKHGEITEDLEAWVRVSVANVGDEDIVEVANRLRRFANEWSI